MEWLATYGISESDVINTGLNALGYFCAAMLALMVYNAFTKKRLKAIALETIIALQKSAISSDDRVLSQVQDTNANSKDNSFVSFPESHSSSVAERVPNANDSVTSGDNSNYGRNRSEVIRLARKMLSAGNSPERVADLLPLSESEMRMVQLGSSAR